MEGKLPIDATQCEQDLADDLRKLLISKDFFDVEFEIEGKITGKYFILSQKYLDLSNLTINRRT